MKIAGEGQAELDPKVLEGPPDKAPGPFEIAPAPAPAPVVAASTTVMNAVVMPVATTVAAEPVADLRNKWAAEDQAKADKAAAEAAKPGPLSGSVGDMFR